VNGVSAVSLAIPDGAEVRRSVEAPRAVRPEGQISLRVRLRRWFFRRLLRAGMAVYLAAMAALKGISRRPRPIRPGEGCEILLTGTFYSENWIAAHLRPLAMAARCARVRVVSTFPIPPIPKVEAIYPPAWLRRVLGDVPARLLTFAWTALRTRPHFVGGFHLLVNGLLAAFLAPLVGARSIYNCTGGPAELLDGGIWAENRLFGKLDMPDAVVECRLLRAVREFDLLIVRGEGAREVFRKAGVCAPIHVVTGGIDARRFFPARDAPIFDVILVGRLTEVKRVDVFLRAVQIVARQLSPLSACVVGGGSLRDELENLADELGIADRVRFVGQQNDVERWLRRARIFVLTSDNEGLALSLIEAMLCGLPAIESNVGDLPDLVRDGQNGFLVLRGRPEAFAARIMELLSDSRKLTAFSAAARRDALEHEAATVSARWNEILQGLPSTAAVI